MTVRVLGRAAAAFCLYVMTLLLAYFANANDVTLLMGLGLVVASFISLGLWAVWNYKKRNFQSLAFAVPFTSLLHLPMLWLMLATGAGAAGRNIF